jgi:hypothetical protein
MAAATSSTVWSITPLAGIDLGSKSSSPGFDLLTNTAGVDGKRWFYVKASEAIGSIETIKVGAAGSASTDAGTAGFTANVPGGATTGQFFWCKKTAL